MDNVAELLKLTDVTVVGLLIAFIAVVGGLFLSGRLFTKGQMDAQIKDCDELKAALAASVAENKQCAKDYQAQAVLAARFEERANFQQWSRQGSQP